VASIRTLPTQEEREWLLARLRELIEAAGWERFVSALPVFPREEFFPDRWTADAFGIRRLALRLLRYAGLSHFEVMVDIFEEERAVELDPSGRVRSMRHRGAAAWFAGIEDDVCFFGTEVAQLGDPLGVVAAMAHEVAHAFRRYHHLEVLDRAEEELLTDLTTVYLGFGILTTNASSRHRSSGDMSGAMWSHQSLGYLPAQALGFLLGAWTSARSLDSARVREIASALETNQAADFKAALKWLRKRRPGLAAELGLPPREKWPKLADFAELTAPIHDAFEEVEARVKTRPEGLPAGRNVGRPVFRVRRTRAVQIGGAAFVLTAVASVVLARLVDPGSLVMLLVAAGVLGAGLGSQVRNDRCSDPDCRHPLSPLNKVCPGCEGDVRGEIARERDRLDAEEALAERSDQANG